MFKSKNHEFVWVHIYACKYIEQDLKTHTKPFPAAAAEKKVVQEKGVTGLSLLTYLLSII